MSDSFTDTPNPKQRVYPNLNRGRSGPGKKGRPGKHDPRYTNVSKDALGLTERQRQAVDTYFDMDADMRMATIALGSSGRALLTHPAVIREIARRGVLVSKATGITPEDVIRNLLRIGDNAEAAGQYAPAIKAQELVGRQIGMFVERHLNINVDATRQHIEALKAKMAERKHPKLIGNASLVTKDDPFADL